MPKIVLKQKYRGKKDASVVVSSNRNIVVKKKYRKPKTNIKKLAYQLAKLSCEKKEIGMYATGLSVGQISVSAGGLVSSGHYMSTLFTPSPSNGNTDTTRIGDEISLTGMYNELQFIQQSNANIKIRGKIYIVSPRLGSSYATATIDKFLNPNAILYSANLQTVFDYTSSRQMDNFKNWRVLRTKNFSVSSDLASTTQRMVSTIKCGMKFKKPWKIRYDAAGNVSEGQLYMIVVTDTGNVSSNAPSGSGTGSTTGIPITDTLSGLSLNYFSKAYFIDP